jgi:hypothetical protein
VAKRVTKSKIKQPQFQAIVPSEQIVEHTFINNGSNPSEPTSDYKKQLQSAILEATQEFMRINKDAILDRAKEILKAQGL